MDASRAALSSHARSRMARRGIAEAELRAVLATPDAVLAVTPSRVVVQGRVRAGRYLLRIVVDVDGSSCEIVTAYLTSKLAKYGTGP